MPLEKSTGSGVAAATYVNRAAGLSMQGADNDSDLLQNPSMFGASVLHGQPVTLHVPEVCVHLPSSKSIMSQESC